MPERETVRVERPDRAASALEHLDQADGAGVERWRPSELGELRCDRADLRHVGDHRHDVFVAHIVEQLGLPVIVKPNSQGSTVGLTLVREEAALPTALEEAAGFDDEVMIEQYIPGRELTVGILGNEPLPVIEIIPEEGLYTYEAKYTKGKSRYEVPANLPEDLAALIREAGVAAYLTLGGEGFARVDFRLAPDDTFWCLEVNTIPGMTPLSLVPMAAQAAGISFERVLTDGADMLNELAGVPGVTFGLLHGVRPHGLIYCYEMGRKVIDNLNVVLPPPAKAIEFYETCANVMYPCRVIGVAVNGQHFAEDEVAAECESVSKELGLPTCDVIHHGPQKLVDAVIQLKRQLNE